MSTTSTLSGDNRRPGVKRQRGLLAVAVAFALSPFLFAQNEPLSVKPEEFKGKVMPLAKVLEKHGARLDADAAPAWLALVTDDGKVYPLIKDDGSRMFFLDPRLLDRPMRLTGQLVPGSQLLQVIVVHSYRQGELNEVYYWCEVCSIRRSQKQICECCGRPMELREEPVMR